MIITMIKDNLGKRMKDYEKVTTQHLIKRLPVIIRIDGNAFHTYTKGMVKPFDEDLAHAMKQTMIYLCEKVPDCRLGYTQSDEITLVLTNDISLEYDAWFNNKLPKLISLTASRATFKFNELMFEKTGKPAFFDSRAFNVPNPMEVANNLHWRQADAERNSVSSLAQSLYSQKELNGISSQDLKVKMLNEKGVDWDLLDTYKKRGICCRKTEDGWGIDENTPKFKDNWEYILSLFAQ